MARIIHDRLGNLAQEAIQECEDVRPPKTHFLTLYNLDAVDVMNVVPTHRRDPSFGCELLSQQVNQFCQSERKMSKRENLTASELGALLDYDPGDGLFRWKVNKGGGRSIGKIAGCVCPDGYVRVGIHRLTYLAHRLAWLHVTGKWPPDEIDHINLIAHDNRFANLRLADRSTQCANKRAHKDNKLGVKGVCAQDGKFIATITKNGKQHYLGLYETAEQAATAYREAAERLFGEFARAS